jgi:hypothetical protein
MNSDEVRTAERIRRGSIWLCWSIALAALGLALFTNVTQIVVVLIFLGAFVPYLLGQKYGARNDRHSFPPSGGDPRRRSASPIGKERGPLV